ncbi:hypothetical protein P7C70_g4691, partial [Phenoliferia sp. Uapishka_3]
MSYGWKNGKIATFDDLGAFIGWDELTDRVSKAYDQDCPAHWSNGDKYFVYTLNGIAVECRRHHDNKEYDAVTPADSNRLVKVYFEGAAELISTKVLASSVPEVQVISRDNSLGKVPYVEDYKTSDTTGTTKTLSSEDTWTAAMGMSYEVAGFKVDASVSYSHTGGTSVTTDNTKTIENTISINVPAGGIFHYTTTTYNSNVEEEYQVKVLIGERDTASGAVGLAVNDIYDNAMWVSWSEMCSDKGLSKTLTYIVLNTTLHSEGTITKTY